MVKGLRARVFLPLFIAALLSLSCFSGVSRSAEPVKIGYLLGLRKDCALTAIEGASWNHKIRRIRRSYSELLYPQSSNV
jgi:hypothetical protein